MNITPFYPIGTLGQAWGNAERSQWRANQSVKRRYNEDVFPRIKVLADDFEITAYGQLKTICGYTENYAAEFRRRKSTLAKR